MSVIDIIIWIAILGGGFYGWRKGIIGQLGLVGGVVLGIIICRTLGPSVAQWLSSIHSQPSSATDYIDSMLARAFIFAVCIVGAGFIAKMVKIAAHMLMLGLFDRLAGVVFSVFSWLLAVSVLLNIYQCINPEDDFAAKSNINNGQAVKCIMDMAPDVLGGISPSQLFDD